MRYYKIVATSPTSGKDTTWTSFAEGKTDPNALNIEIDAPIAPFAQPGNGGAAISIWGISLADISQASNFNGSTIAVYGGMQKGLPLADPAQSGLLFKGVIYQAWGNWVGVNQTLNFLIYPGVGSVYVPKNIVLDWKKNTPLSQAITQTLSTAFPDLEADVKISDKLVLSHDVPGYYYDLVTFAQYVKQASLAILGGSGSSYAGVDITISDKTIKVYDTPDASNPTMLAFKDMIGQPTWIEPLTVDVKLVMRADLEIGDYIQFPPAVVTSSAGLPGPQINAKATFQGKFLINYMRHLGNFRQPDGGSWVTDIHAVSTTPVTA